MEFTWNNPASNVMFTPAKMTSPMGGPIMDQTEVGLRLMKHVLLSEVGEGRNMVFSPASIHVALSLLASGCSGPTRQQLLSFLRSNSTQHLNHLWSELVDVVLANGTGAPNLRFVNGLWVDQTLSLKPAFNHLVDNVYKATSDQVDFINNASEVITEVNSWVEEQTKGLIKEVLPPGSVDTTTRLIFANAIYFKGAWKDKFDASQTKNDDFYLLDGSVVKVPFMTSKEDQFIQAFDGFKVLRLPYKQGEDQRSFSMYFYLPDTKDSLPALIEKMSSQSNFIDQYRPLRQVTVGDFKLPKFKMSFKFEASKVLKSLGVEWPFIGGGLTEIVVETNPPISHKLYVSSIHHSAFIEVNEEGTEAAAATAMVFCMQCAMLPKDFVADHPFMFLIREDTTGVVLFTGCVMNPLETSEF